MKKHSKKVDRSQVKPRDVLNTDDGDAISARANLARFVTVGSLLLAAVAIGLAWFNSSAAKRSQHSLERAESNVLLLSQQVNQVFGGLDSTLRSSEQLTAEQRRLMDSWLRFDEQFLSLNHDDPQLQLELTSTAQRLAMLKLRLGQYDEAERFFAAARQGLSNLQKNFPENFLYRHDEAANWIAVATMRARAGHSAEVTSALHNAAELLELQAKQISPELDNSLQGLLGELARVAFMSRDYELARRASQSYMDVLQRLVVSQPNKQEEYAQRMNEARALLLALEGS
mgnify:CR=1 FL=1